MTDNKQFVAPRTLKGFQDLLPEDFIPRRRVIRIIEDIFERYGFLPLETPALEHAETLLGTGGDETNKELFQFESPEGEPIALRYDLTVGFARLLAQYSDKLKAPFRRYAVGPVWRVNKPGPGRFRQFTQLDIDAAGSESVAVDAEIISVMCAILEALGVERFTVLVNDRKLMDALLDSCGIADAARQKHVLRVIDKLAKAGLDNVRLELAGGRVDESGDPIAGVGLDEPTIGRIIDFIGIRGATRAETVAHVAQVLPDTDTSRAAVAEMQELAAALEGLGVPEERVRFDPSLARGLDYYTGPVFEAVLDEAEAFGSVMGGGRYNQLVERFSDRQLPCTGMSVGLDRLTAALVHLGRATQARSTVEALVVTMGKVVPAETLKLAAELRRAGIRTEAYFGPRMNLKTQLSYADRHGIAVAVILGEDELARGVVSIKDLQAGKQQRETIADHAAYRNAGKTGQVTVPRGETAATVQTLLGRG